MKKGLRFFPRKVDSALLINNGQMVKTISCSIASKILGSCDCCMAGMYFSRTVSTKPYLVHTSFRCPPIPA